jgi:soluble lytic murein transglycosylase-like protein
MNAMNTSVPYYYLCGDTAAEPTSPPRAASASPILALIAGLLLITSYAPEAGLVPPTEIIPLNDSQADLTLTDVVSRFEAHWGAAHKNEAYRLGKLVIQLSEQHQLSPSLILAVVEHESSFRPAVVSKAGAVGLMQLLPDTAAEVAALYHIRSYKSAADLRNPAVNLRLGVAYLAYLRHQFGHSLHYLAAYNLGPTALRKRLREGNYELGALDHYVRSIHETARELQGGRGGKMPETVREDALMAASL